MTTFLLASVMMLGQTPTPPAVADPVETAESKEAIELARREVARYRLHLGGDPQAALTLQPEPILRWTNHLRRRFYGDVFIWTYHGRPEAVATITNVYGNRHAIETEAHSLSLTSLAATREGQPLWHPALAGIQLRPVLDAPEVAANSSGRLQQMRGMARQFSAFASPMSKRQQLRMLSRPVYRYASTDPLVVDGAMFAFTNGTDPDVFLLIEARRISERHEWQFAVARFNAHTELQVSYNGREVWTAARLDQDAIRNPESCYFAVQRRFPASGDERQESAKKQ